MTETTGELLLGMGDGVVARIGQRLEGLSDDEHGWRPVPDAWTVLDDGTVEHADARTRPDPAPLTTLSWRLWHIGNECLCSFASRGWDTQPVDIALDRWFPTAAESGDAVAAAWSGLRAAVVAKGQAHLDRQLGPSWGPYAEATYAGLLAHVLDEVIHHGAEVGMQRDLYRARSF